MSLASTFTSKLPNVGTTIFTTMSKMAQEHNAINLSQGFPDFNPPPLLMELAAKYMQKGYNQYAPMAGVMKLRERLAEKNDFLYGVKINPETEITITAGASQAIAAAVTAFVHPGDEVIIIEPAFDVYQPLIEVNGGKVVPYRIEAPHFKINWQAFEQLITPKTRMIVLNTPHNPTGAILEASDWQALSTIVDNTNILIISDEVYEHIMFDGKEHQSILRFPALWHRSFVVFSFGKTFHCTGWKMGYVAAPEYLTKELRKNHQFSIFCVNHFIQEAIADFLTDRSYYEQLPHFFQVKKDLFGQILTNTRFTPIPTYGSYFQLADYSNVSDESDIDFAIRMTKEHKVAVIPVSVFYSNDENEQRNHLNAKLIRFCFGKTEQILHQASEKLCKI